MAFITGKAQQQKPEGFNIQRGVNLSHWLSQTGGRRGISQSEYFTEKDMAFIAESGFDHIRIPVDESELWDYKDEKYKDAFTLLHKTLEWCKQYHLRAIVDLHILRSHDFNAKDQALWDQDAAQERFLQIWRELSAELKKYPVSQVAYELLNEPVADSAQQWNDLLAKGIQLIRQLEPNRVIIAGSNQFESYSTFPQLKIPAGEKRTILSFHYSNPFYFTHYQASGTRHKDYSGPVHYPGPTITPNELNEQPATIRNLLAGSTQEYNEDVIQEQMDVPLKFAKKQKLTLYCGEWGCINTVSRRDRLRWYKDMRKVLEKNNIAWAIWDYKGAFGIVDDNGDPDKKLIKILTKD
ncbi:glycoside hydrolase family 5 protein [Chitinophaga sp. CF118]|uniref:glycoside hydrolase family 5 protein n=1 Tax=Chitinophaga sp. CF118 TaxID=1884367 RepID=UPI002101764A|nr:glycoside hydrolase family 5 protein [Chitinophaga sp. CF118]